MQSNYTPKDWEEEKTKHLHKKGPKNKLDNYKGYDRIWRQGLWAALRKLELGNKFVSLLEQLYRSHNKIVVN